MLPFIYRTASFCAAFTFCIALSAYAHAALEPIPEPKGLQITKPIYAWKTEHENDSKNGTFNHCLVKNMYDNGTVLMLAENHSGVQRLALHFPQDKMDVGQHFDLTIQIDKRALFPVEAVAVSEQILTIGIPEALPDQMRKGQAMYLRGPNDEVVYTMEGMDGAVTALRDCVMTQKNPDLKKVRDDTQVADAPTEDAPAEDTKVASVEKAESKPLSTAIEQEEPSKKPVVQPLKPIEKTIEIAEVKQVEKVKPVEKSVEKPVEKAQAEPEPKQVSNAKTDPVIAKRMAKAEKPTPAPEAVSTPIVTPPVKKEEAPKVAEKAAPVVSPPVKQAKAVQASLLPTELHAIVSQAGLTPKTLLNTSPSATDYIWQHDGLFVSVKEHDTVSAAEFEKTALHYLSVLKKRCTGIFVAESAPTMKNKAATMSWQIAETACSSKAGQDTIAALLFSHDGSQLRVYLVEGPAARGADAIKARDRLLPYALRSN